MTRLDESVGLTPRELEIARLATGRLSSREIAAHLVVAVRTVDNTLGLVYAKLGIERREELAPIFTASECIPAPLRGPLTPAARVSSQIG